MGQFSGTLPWWKTAPERPIIGGSHKGPENWCRARMVENCLTLFDDFWRFLPCAKVEKRRNLFLNRRRHDKDFPQWDKRWFLERGWGQQLPNFRVRRFTEWPGPLHWIGFSCRHPYQAPHSLNASHCLTGHPKNLPRLFLTSKGYFN